MDLSEFLKDQTENLLLFSQVPNSTKKEPCMLGIDEAGRGPVLGPMVYGAAYCPVSELNNLKEKGVADSKTLTEKKREELFQLIDESKDMLGWIIEVISPNVISNSMLQRSKCNLNTVSHNSAITLIRKALELGVFVTEIYVDTVGPAEVYQKKLSALFPHVKITVASKADSIYPIVSAASICAKVARDNALKAWKFEEGEHFNDVAYGSGYPNDPVTKKFLVENIDPVFGFPQLVRFSWSTAANILQDKAVKVEWEKIDDDPATTKSKSLKTFFNPEGSKEEPPSKRHHFFKKRCLHQAVEL